MINSVLEGRRILVCRPQPAASELSTVLGSVGARTLALPCIDIKPLIPDPSEKALVYDLDQFSKVVVVSQHAARFIIDLIGEVWPQYPEQQTWFGIGRKTAQTLNEAGLQVVEPEADLDSEALLEKSLLKTVKGEKILIAKGRGGRSKLEQGLRDRGAKVSTIDLYERAKPDYDQNTLTEALISFQPDGIITLSAETIDNLHDFAGEVNSDLTQVLIIVPSQRVANHARTLGYQNVRITQALKPIDLIKSLASKA